MWQSDGLAHNDQTQSWFSQRWYIWLMIYILKMTDFFFWKWQKFIKNWFLEVGTLLFSILLCRIQERNFNCHDFLEIETGFLVMGSGFPVMMVSPGWSVIRSALFYVLCVTPVSAPVDPVQKIWLVYPRHKLAWQSYVY